MDIIQLVISQAIAFALMGVAVRTQYAIFRGFDLIAAPVVVVCAELFSILSFRFRFPTPLGVVICSTLSVFVGVGIVVLWNWSIDRIWRAELKLGAGILLCSLGVSTAVSGLVGLLRGPGLRQPIWTSVRIASHLGYSVTLPTIFATVFGGVVIWLIFLWARRRSGLALDLWSQNQEFALELGVARNTLVLPCGVVTGGVAGVFGCYLALTGGSTPEGGLTAFLYGAGSALLFPAPTINAALLGGAILGLLFVVIQLMFNPALASQVLFSVVAILLVYRGTSRNIQGVR